MFRKIISGLVICVMFAALLSIVVSAGAMNPAGGCQTAFTVKRASVPVAHDGVISEGEYTEIEINRNSETTDMLLSWDGPSQMVEFSFEFLQNVHYYISWDDNGINFAAKATLLEDPYCEGTFPTNFEDYPGDEFFMFQFGFLVKIENPNDRNNHFMYHSIGKNTETGELLNGYYWYPGIVPFKPVAERDYSVAISGRTVTYEISCPHSAIFASEQLTGGIPAAGTKFYTSLTLTGGSLGNGHNGNATYGVSLGDGGFMTLPKVIENYSGAVGTLSADPVSANGDQGDQGGQGGQGGNQGSGDQQVVIDPDKYEVKTDESGNEVIIDKATGETVDRNSLPAAARTGDPMIVMAAIAAVSAAGAFIVKKRKF